MPGMAIEASTASTTEPDDRTRSPPVSREVVTTRSGTVASSMSGYGAQDSIRARRPPFEYRALRLRAETRDQPQAGSTSARRVRRQAIASFLTPSGVGSPATAAAFNAPTDVPTRRS